MADLPAQLPVSWADHWEDVRLWRVLHRLRPGFYVDVGAMDPSADSVTRACYDLGWSGIDVEPNPHFAGRLRAERQRDRIEQVAAGERAGRVVLHVVMSDEGEQTGLTTVEGAIAERHAKEGGTVEPVEVDVVRLADLMAGTAAAEPDRFHFLKVDVEGHEHAVLAGADLSRFRPLVVVVEARAPRRAEDTYAPSEALLTSTGYLFAADDGLNRWYVRREDEPLVAVLAPETNPLLDGKPRRWWEVARERDLTERMDELDAAAQSAAAEADALRDEAAELKAQLDLIRRSRSWRMTAPLRAVQRALRGR
jgi:FkbM family methyltransferase